MPDRISSSAGGGPKLKLHHKLAIIFCLFAVLISGLTTYFLYRTALKQVMEDIRHRLHDIVAIAPAAIDAELLAGLTEPGQEGSSEYLAVRKVLQTIRDSSTDIHFIYTMRSGPGGEILFVVDAETNPDEIAHLGEEYTEAGDALRANFAHLDRPLVEKDVYVDNWGTWLSGYAPITASDGSRVGVLGVDIAADTITAYRRRLLGLALGVFALTLPLTLILGYVIGLRLARPIVTIQQGAERIGRGDLDAAIDIERSDEIGALATSFNEMARNLKESRADLNAMMEDYRDLFDNAVEGIYRSTFQGRFTAANQALIRMLGYESLDDLTAHVTDIGTQIYDRTEDREAFKERLGRDGRVENLEVRLKRKDGSVFWVDLTAQVVQRGQEPPFIEGMVLDITQRLEKDRAEKERRAAEAASKAKSEFLANMSHEIRTPLGAVMGLTDLVMKTDLDEKQFQYLGKIKSSSRTLLAVINDILDISKIESGHMELEETPFSLYEVIANLTEMFAYKAHEKDIEFMAAIDPAVPADLIGDPTRLGQVLINLSGNAMKFTEQGEILVSVSLERPLSEAADDPVCLRFSVKDTGAGIPPDRLEHIFESFAQADSSITRRHGGTGLGLTICRELTRLMGGDIQVESEPGRGSEFSFTAEFQRRWPEQRSDAAPPLDLRGLRVLVVDDNSTSREILSSFLTSFHMDAVAVGSGKEAVDLIEKEGREFDLILMDWKMPGMNGLEAAGIIKRKFSRDRLPIVCMVSAYGRKDLLSTAEQSLLDAFLYKPVNQSLLFDTIVELFGRKDRTAGRPAPTAQVPSEDLSDLPAGKKILLVEDNPINQEIVREWLESAGVAVEISNNGAEAVERLSREGFDAVLMDVQMPVMDGLAATEHIRNKLGLTELPIIAMTAHALAGDRETCLAAGMNDYVTKPIDPSAFFAALSRRLAGVEYHSDVEAQAEPGPAPPELPGIDTRTGLLRANNNLRLYLKLLRSFAADYGSALDRMTADLEAGRTEAVTREAHSLKGIGGNIGAVELQEKAARVEQVLTAGELDLESADWNEFAGALQQVLHGLAEADLTDPTDGVGAPVGDPGPDPSQWPDQLKRLAALLDEDLEQARSLMESLRPGLSESSAAELFLELTEKMDNFELDEAAEILESLIAFEPWKKG